MRTRLFGLVLAVAISGGASVPACPICRPKVMANVYTPAFGGTLALLLLPLGIMGGIAFGVGRLDRPVARRAP